MTRLDTIAERQRKNILRMAVFALALAAATVAITAASVGAVL